MDYHYCWLQIYWVMHVICTMVAVVRIAIANGHLHEHTFSCFYSF